MQIQMLGVLLQFHILIHCQSNTQQVYMKLVSISMQLIVELNCTFMQNSTFMYVYYHISAYLSISTICNLQCILP